MGRARSHPPIARSRAAWYRRLLMDPASLRYWACIVACAALAAVLVGQAAASHHAARRRWGPGSTVWVTTGAVAAGSPVDGRVRAVRWPEAIQPPSTLARIPGGTVAATDLPEGVPLVSGSVRTPGRGVDRGRRTVAIPAELAVLPTRPGARVDVWASPDPGVSADAAIDAAPSAPSADPLLGPRRIAAQASVVEVTEEVTVLLVRADEVADIATAIQAGSLTVVGRG